MKHFAETFPESKEKKELEVAWCGGAMKEESAVWRYSRAVYYFGFLNYLLIVLLWLSSGLGAVCMSKAQPAHHS